jgi:hypothetical protein
VTRGKDAFGRSEFFLGVCLKPRGVNFDVFHRSAEAENCYGPLHRERFDDRLADDPRVRPSGGDAMAGDLRPELSGAGPSDGDSGGPAATDAPVAPGAR